MADNLGYTPGAGATIAAKDVAGVHHQRLLGELSDGGTPVDAPGDATYGQDVDVTRQLHGVSAAVTDAWSTADSLNDVTPTFAIAGHASVVATIVTDGGTCSAGELAFEASPDGGTTWVQIVGVADQYALGVVYPMVVMTLTDFAGTPYTFKVSWDVASMTHFRARIATAITGTLDVALRLMASSVPAPSAAVLSMLNAGTTHLGDVGIAGAALTSLQLLDNVVRAEDAAHVSGDEGVLVLGVRRDTPSSLVGADNDNIPFTTDSLGRIYTSPPTCVRAAATPTISASLYAIGDFFGTVMTFSSAALANGGCGRVANAVITHRDTETPLLELWLFRNSPTMVNTDNGVFELTDANMEAAELLGIIEFSAWWTNGSAGVVSQGVVRGMPVSGAPIPYVCASGGTSIYGALAIRNASTPASTSDAVVTLTLERL